MLNKHNIGLKWTHPCEGLKPTYCNISYQKARALMDKDGQKDCKLPRQGFLKLLGQDLVIANRNGQYSIDWAG